MTCLHDTLDFNRTIAAPVDRVWAAYADVAARSAWSVPAGEVIVYDTADFAAGGADTYRCGPPGDLVNAGTHHYHLIEPQRRLIYTDTVHREGQLMAVALLRWEFEDLGDSTRVTIVDQVTSLVGSGMIDGHRNGHTMALDQLAAYLIGQHTWQPRAGATSP